MSARALTVLFASAMSGSALLLFLVQPMFAKMVLPLLGGTPAVWNTCVLFFQTMLLCGYAYAHLVTRRLTLRTQAVVHLIVLLSPAIALPIAVRGSTPPGAETPVWWLLGVLLLSSGLPFFVVATTAPLLQRWFSTLPHPSARDPYFLYAASNVGSIAGLLAYPFIVERTWRLVDQSRGWSFGYAVVALLIGTCGLAAARYARHEDALAMTSPLATTLQGDTPRTAFSARVWWLALSFIPSSLMLGVTTHISTDIAAVPLLWVVPLVLYLVTFIVAFAARSKEWLRWCARVLPFGIVAVLATMVFELGAWATALLHLTTFFIAALVCHGALAERRPEVADLTSFYLWISIGGALGGVFNTLVAPFAFVTVAEYPLMLALLAFLRPAPSWRRGRLEAVALVAGLPSIVAVVVLSVWLVGGIPNTSLQDTLILLGMGCAAALGLANRTRPFGVAVTIVAILLSLVVDKASERVLLAARSFFGVHQVIDDVPHRSRRLRHGSTLHGQQQLTALDRCEPTTYYHPSGPIGQIFTALGERARDVAVIGLGSGSLACYAQSGARWTFYEIDPLVVRIARDSSFFSFLRNSHGQLRMVLGDGRLTLAAAQPSSLDVIVVDAFSSDAIPMHLLTEEFLAIAVARLRPAGVLALHVSNRYLDLEPVVAAGAARLGLSAFMQRDRDLSDADREGGKTASNWIILARENSEATSLVTSGAWRAAMAGRSVGWTDDFSNIFDAVTWNRPVEAAARER